MTETKTKSTREAKADEVREIMAHSDGSEQFYKHFIPGVIYTEGVFNIAEAAGAHWLIDVVASYQPELRKKASVFTDTPGIPFQIWRLAVDLKEESCVVTCHEDWSEERPDKYPAIVTQEIEYTDFPCSELKLYAENNHLGGVTIMLPGER